MFKEKSLPKDSSYFFDGLLDNYCIRYESSDQKVILYQ